MHWQLLIWVLVLLFCGWISKRMWRRVGDSPDFVTVWIFGSLVVGAMAAIVGITYSIEMMAA